VFTLSRYGNEIRRLSMKDADFPDQLSECKIFKHFAFSEFINYFKVRTFLIFSTGPSAPSRQHTAIYGVPRVGVISKTDFICCQL